MLRQFTAVAELNRESLPPRYYRRRRVKFAILLEHSRSRSLIPLGDGDGTLRPVPTIYRSGSKPPPALIADTAEYVLGLPKDDTDKAQRDAAAKHASYIAMIEAFAEAHPDEPAVNDLLAFFQKGHAAVFRRTAAAEGAGGSDLITFMVGDVWAHETIAAQTFWTQEVMRRKSTGVDTVCCVCGEYGPVLSSLPEAIPVGAIPVVDSTGRSARGNECQLASVNNLAQARAGKLQLGATPICVDCGGDAVAGLSGLLADERTRRRNRDSAIVWWSTDQVVSQNALFPHLDQPKPEAVRDFLDQLYRPAKNRGADEELRRFRAITVAANKSRVVFRSSIDLALRELRANLEAWYDDTRIDTGAGPADGTLQGLWLLAAATGRPAANGQGYQSDSVMRGVEQQLLACALSATPPPIALLPRVLHRITQDGRVDPPRAALLRLCLRRSPFQSPVETLMPGLDEDAKDAPYQCGRLLRVLESIQSTAIPELNVTLAERYRSLGRNPAPLRQLVENSKGHFIRLNRSSATKPAAYRLQERLEDVLERIGDNFPARFTAAEQGRFTLGYYHQRAADRRARAAGAAAKRARDNGDSDPEAAA